MWRGERNAGVSEAIMPAMPQFDDSVYLNARQWVTLCFQAWMARSLKQRACKLFRRSPALSDRRIEPLVAWPDLVLELASQQGAHPRTLTDRK
jgi:hypothetical protein